MNNVGITKEGFPIAGEIYSYEPAYGREKSFRLSFAKAKKAFKPVIANQDNPFFKSKYASLADYHHAVDDALLANGFTLHQPFESDGLANYLVTKLTHIDGHSEVSKIRLMDAADPQKMGSCISYFRRYSLAAILGIPVEDDDGNTASKFEGGKREVGKSVSPSSSPELRTPASPEFRFTFGKFKGKSFAEIPLEDLVNYMNWLKEQKDSEKNHQIFNAFNGWHLKRQVISHKDFEVPPPYDDEDLPNPFR